MGQIDNYLDRISLLKKLTWLITPATKVKNSLNHFVGANDFVSKTY